MKDLSREDRIAIINEAAEKFEQAGFDKDDSDKLATALTDFAHDRHKREKYYPTNRAARRATARAGRKKGNV